VLISPRQLVDRLRYPRTRADELAALRARFRAQPSRHEASEEQRALADELRALRVKMAELLASVTSCSGCAKGHPLPHGRWQGGHCCGGRTLDIFQPSEVAALALGGTRPSALPVPKSDHAGCVYRGPEGCSLEPADRPSLCVRFLCLELKNELRARDDWRAIAETAAALRDTFRRFEALTSPRAGSPEPLLLK
jgi:hypothetical protein